MRGVPVLAVSLVNVSEDLPWGRYDKDRLRSGLSYAIGRDLIERSLREAGAVVGSLVFAVPVNGYPILAVEQKIVEVFWFSTLKNRYWATAPETPGGNLMMRVWAVDSARRHEISGPLADAVPEVCRWIANASARGTNTVWSAMRHELTVRYSNHRIHLSER